MTDARIKSSLSAPLTERILEKGSKASQHIDLLPIPRLGEAKQEDTRCNREKSHGEFPASARPLHHEGSQHGSRNATSRLIGVPGVCCVEARVAKAGVLLGEVSTQEAVVKRVGKLRNGFQQSNLHCSFSK